LTVGDRQQRSPSDVLRAPGGEFGCISRVHRGNSTGVTALLLPDCCPDNQGGQSGEFERLLIPDPGCCHESSDSVLLTTALRLSKLPRGSPVALQLGGKVGQTLPPSGFGSISSCRVFSCFPSLRFCSSTRGGFNFQWYQRLSRKSPRKTPQVPVSAFALRLTEKPLNQKP